MRRAQDGSEVGRTTAHPPSLDENSLDAVVNGIRCVAVSAAQLHRGKCIGVPVF
jgi:hypothetical protein